jgi:hypothetical protein
MARREGSLRILISSVCAVLFIATQVLFQAGGWAGGVCVDSLAEPTRDPVPMNAWTDYGFPLPLLRRSTLNCDPAPVWEILWFGLFVNAGVFCLAGYGINRLLVRRRLRRNAPLDP